MNASHVIRALGFSGLMLAVSACEDFSGQDPSIARQEVTQDECINRGGTSQVNPQTNELVCIVPNAAASAGMTPAAAAAAGIAVVTVFAISNSSSGTR